MPLVRIDIMEGRPPEKIRELHGRVAALVAEILDTPIDRVRTYITQFPPEGWGIGGGAGGGPAEPGPTGPAPTGPPPGARPRLERATGRHCGGGRSHRGDREGRGRAA